MNKRAFQRFNGFLILVGFHLTAVCLGARAVDMQQASRSLGPYDGPSVKGVDTSTLTGKVMCGYQGWFTCEGDGSGKGWFHYGGRGRFTDGYCSIDFWPDVSECDEDELYATDFKHSDGSTAYVFSSMNKKTVVRHFKWMKDYGIDGAFVQRFVGQTRRPLHVNTVLSHCREGANLHGRAYAVMYDLSGMRADSIHYVIDDWKRLVDLARITRSKKDRAYLHHKGRPVVAIWGVGFNDGRRYTLEECGKIVDFFRNDAKYGNCTVMLGVPSYWRTFGRDAVNDKRLHEVVLKADIISPWSVGRMSSLRSVERYAEEVWQEDLLWCKRNGKDYLPVAFPGFSWHNMKPTYKLDQIPRLEGRFLWKQYYEIKKAGATMIYQAMFDEMDEGTCIFKCEPNPPVGKSKFLSYGNLPTDHYLWLAGQGGRMLRGQIEHSSSIPPRQ